MDMRGSREVKAGGQFKLQRTGREEGLPKRPRGRGP